MQAINVFIQDRNLVRQVMGKLSPVQLLHIPPGFDNNIAWNIGHILVVQQLLHYKLSGLTMAVTDEQVAMYRTGTSPTDWTIEPDITQLIPLLKETSQTLATDYQAEKFSNYQAYTTSTGISLPTIEDAISFNNFHEGVHVGFILALRNLVVDIE